MIPAALWPDPRETRVYRTARTHWLRALGNAAPCCMCGMLVDCTLPGTHRLGPTIEHSVSIRWIRANARSKHECEAFACDTQTWGLAHKRCNSEQGARVVNAARRTAAPAPTPMVGASRVW